MSDTTSTCPLPMLELKDVAHTRGVGVLHVNRGEQRAVLPLTGVAISARVADRVATVTVSETFRNPCSEPLEAVYIFPLAGGAAVCDFELKVGARTIKGKVEERGEARRQYQQALDQGKRAALLEQERDDVFTVQVGNLPPGEEVRVTLVYSERLPFFEDGATEIRLPLVVAPRYIPGAPLDREPVGDGVEWDTTAVPDASRITPPRLAKGFDPKVALAIEVELARGAGAPDLADLTCSQHATRTSLGAGGFRIALSRVDEPLDRDFVLRWRLAQAKVQSTLLVHRNPAGEGFGMLSILPPRRDGFLGIARDVVFVVDRSGSMQGVKMASAARACSLLLATLGPRDRFAIQAFDNSTEWHVPPGAAAKGEAYFSWADEAALQRGDAFLRTIDARGGTELDLALGDALGVVKARRETAGRVPVVVLLTDGQVGDESRVLKRIQQELGDARVFTVGIDTAVNDGFLKRLASLAGGTATFVTPGTGLEEALCAVGREIGAPLIVDVTVEDVDAGIDAKALAPGRIPDLFQGRAVTVFLPVQRAARVRVRGRFVDGGSFDETVSGQEIALPAIAHLWARARVADLEDRFRLEPQAQADLKSEIIRISVRHTLLTRFTAFVVVDEVEVVNADGSRRKVVQPVEMPARWDMKMESEKAMDSLKCISASAGVMRQSLSMSAPVPCSPPPAPSPRRVGNVKKMKESAGEMMECRIADDQAAAPIEDFRPVLKALEDLVQALADARKELDAGRMPPPEPLEKARAQLVAVLSGSSLATEMPQMQRFLRAAAVELVAALRTIGANAAQLRPLFERQAKAFEEARREASLRLAGPVKGGDAFWEASV